MVADRTLGPIRVSIPPVIAELDYNTAGAVARVHEDAAQRIAGTT